VPGDQGSVIIDAKSASWILSVNGLSADTVIEGIAFVNGYDNGSGAAVRLYNSSVQFSNCEFRGNLNGGAMGAAVVIQGGSVSVEGCLFAENSTGYSGAGLFCDGCEMVSIRDCQFVNNTAGISGAAAYCDDCSSVLVTGCRFDGNSAESSGAVQINVCEDGQIVDCVFWANEVTDTDPGASSAMSVVGSQVAFSSCTFAANRGGGDGVGVVTVGAELLKFDRCLIANSTGVPIFLIAGNFMIQCCDFFGNSGGDWVAGYTGWTALFGNFSANPCFCDLDGGELTLAADSYCLPGNHPWGCDSLVGAQAVSCGSVGCGGPVEVETRSWGLVKNLYR